ncbi:alpha/beta hydrolase [Vibrio splendidus]|uniref:alpha/beta hydrolase n=1 Tax=Vibrio splendidus TaxID=29497 RepID=UPI00076A5959|nr:alpha/beta hydrolase fold domain-containing protein [Vibrio splendidus]PHX03641.1 Alpha/beta hydrolase family protein [Vibrio splendidus]
MTKPKTPGVLVASMLLTAVSFSSSVYAGHGFKMSEKVVYGQGQVTVDEKVISRDLWMNVFEPASKSEAAKTAIVMTFGGAFHRGAPDHSYNIDGAQDTSMNDYCQKFVKQDYVCFAIDYRVATEKPLPTGRGYKSEDLDLGSINATAQQINIIRPHLGLSPIDFDNPEEKVLIDNAVLSAAEDLRDAVDHIKDNAKHYGVNPDKIILGGQSAGAISSLNVAHGMNISVAGTFLLSGGPSGFDIAKQISKTNKPSPILLFQGQYDLPALFEINPTLLKHYDKEGVKYTFSWVPGFGHFYPAEAISLSGDGIRMSIEQRIMNFVKEIDDSEK